MDYKTSDIVAELKQIYCKKRIQCDGDNYCPFYIFPQDELVLKNNYNQEINICSALDKIAKAIDRFEEGE